LNELQREAATEAASSADAIYGRAKPLAELQEAFRWASLGSTELVLLSGPSGIGKSALVMKAFRPVISRKCYFIWGKFDAYSRSKPYAVWINCFQFLIQKLLTEPEEVLERWKARFEEAVGSNISVLADVIPEMSLLFDGLQPAKVLPAKENQNRFEWVFRRFVQAFTSSRHPLVLFLDDIQWADRASLQLLHALIEDPENQYFCVVGTYRDMEWTENADIRDQWLFTEAAGYSVRTIDLDNLTMDDVQQWVADTLRMNPDECFQLAHALYVKSIGNPLYLQQLLQSARDEEMIRIDESTGRWVWGQDDLNALPGIEGQVEYLSSRITKLPGMANLLLVHASTLGGSFSSRLLSAISGMDEQEVISHFVHAVQAGLLAIHGSDQESVHYHFTHDRILQTAYSLLDNEERKRIHMAAGLYLLDRREGGGIEEDPFEISNHLNEAVDLLNLEAKEIGVRLNVESGRLAMQASDYGTALRHFRFALRFMPDNSWTQQQASTFRIFLSCCECEYLCANFKQAEALLDEALNYARNWDQRAQAVKLKIDQYSNTGQYAKAIEWGLATLGEVGIRVSAEPARLTVKLEVQRTRQLFHNKMIQFYDIPRTEEPRSTRIIELFASLVGPAFFSNRDVLAVLSSKLARYIYSHGAPPGSETVYVAFGMVLTTMFDDFAGAYRIGRLAIELAERSGNVTFQSRIIILFHAVISQWMRMDERDRGQLWGAARHCMESGDYVFGSYAIGGLINLSYGILPLGELDRVLSQSLQVSELTKEELVLTNIIIYKQLCEQLQSPECRVFDLTTEKANEEQLLEELSNQESGSVTLYQVYTYKTQVHYLFDRAEEAIICAEQASPYEHSAVQSPHLYIHHFYETLALVAAYQQRGSLSRAEEQRLSKRYKQFERWSQMAPDHFHHRFILLQAEMESRKASGLQVTRLYEEAIDTARDRKDWQYWAVACECAAKYHERQGSKRIAGVYWLEAYEAYGRWGVEAKCASMRQLHAEWTSPRALADKPASVTHSSEDKQATTAWTEDEDWLQMVKDTLRFPKDMNFEDTKALLLARLLQVSQASYGCLISNRDDGLRVEQQIHGEHAYSIMQAVLLEHSDAAPRSLVQYVSRVGKPVQLRNALEDDLFQYDPYIVRGSCQAVCCLPIHVQDHLDGVLYLEIPTASYPLKEYRLDTLSILAAQTLFYIRLTETLIVNAPVPAANETEGGDDIGLMPTVPLSDREYEVLHLISTGMTTKEIAIQLGLAPGTVKVHTNSIFNKLNVNRRTQAVAQARKLKLLDP
jgi:predicted ATPase/DNA-binding CsgD family transcriptional regulator